MKVDTINRLRPVLLVAAFVTCLSFADTPARAGTDASQYRRPVAGWVNSLKPKGKAAGAIALAKGGKTGYRILIPTKPTTMEEKAAADLAQWLQVVTGASFPVVKEEPGISPRHVISVGNTAIRDTSGLPKSDLHLDGYAIAVKDGNLFITGGTRRGIIDGVYALLEEDLGCRWYQSGDDGAVIPSLPTLNLRVVPRVYVPPFEMLRAIHYSDARDTDWGLRNKTFHWWGVQSEWGGYAKWVPSYVHTYEWYVSSGLYEKHPEYFMMGDDGKRVTRQICPSNPEVVKIVVDKAKASLQSDPDAVYLDMSPNDGGGACHCPLCQPLIDSEGTEMAPLLKLVNTVADAVREQHPQVYVTTLAYLNTVVPPKTFGPRPNVMIWMCTDAHAWSFTDLFFTETQKSSQAMQAWHDKWQAPSIVWDYPSHWGLAPVNFNMPVIAANLRQYVKNGAKGILFQTEHNPNLSIDHSFQRCWVFAKLGWDPTLDTKALVRDFNSGFYGAAAPEMQAYDDMIWSAWEKWHKKTAKKTPWDTAKAYEKKWSGRVSVAPSFWDAAEKHIDAAEKAVGDDPILKKRVCTARLPLTYIRLEKGPGDDIAAYKSKIKEFEIDARNANCLIVEGVVGPPITEDLTKVINKWYVLIGRKQIPVTPGTLFVDSANFTLAMHLDADQCPEIVRDPLATTGVVTRQPSNNRSWSIQWSVPVEKLEPNRKYAVRIRVRMDAKGTEGPALTTGVYDNVTAKYPFGDISVPAEKLSTSEYRWIELGEYVPGENQVIWVSPTNNAANVSAVYTERIELVPVK